MSESKVSPHGISRKNESLIFFLEFIILMILHIEKKKEKKEKLTHPQSF